MATLQVNALFKKAAPAPKKAAPAKKGFGAPKKAVELRWFIVYSCLRLHS